MKKTIDIVELQSKLDLLISNYIDLISSLDEDKYNIAPQKGTWTPAQIVSHVEKSILGMPEVMTKESKSVQRDLDQRVEEFKKILLDFSKKMKSPDFILPEDKRYDKQKSIDDLIQSAKKFKESIKNANLEQLVEGMPFGPATKLEIVYFVLYHTQRHLHQLKNVSNDLK